MVVFSLPVVLFLSTWKPSAVSSVPVVVYFECVFAKLCVVVIGCFRCRGKRKAGKVSAMKIKANIEGRAGFTSRSVCGRSIGVWISVVAFVS